MLIGSYIRLRQPSRCGLSFLTRIMWQRLSCPIVLATDAHSQYAASANKNQSQSSQSDPAARASKLLMFTLPHANAVGAHGHFVSGTFIDLSI